MKDFSLLAFGLASTAAMAAASSYASGSVVDGCVQLYSATGSVAMGGGEPELQWLAAQERLIVAELEPLLPGLRTLVAGAEADLEGFTPIPWREDLEECQPPGQSDSRGGCYWLLSFDPEIERVSQANGVRLRVAVAHLPPDEARGAILEQLAVVAEGGTASFDGYGESTSAAPSLLSNPWSWAVFAMLVPVAVFVLMRLRSRSGPGAGP